MWGRNGCVPREVLETFHGEGDTVAAEVDVEDADVDVLVEVDYLGGVVHTAVGQLADMN